MGLLQSFFAVKGAAHGFAAGGGVSAADVHAGGHALAVLIIRAVDGVALDVGLGLGRGVAGDHIAVVFGPLGKAVAAGIVFGVGGGAVHTDPLADAQLVLIVGTAADVASQIAHGKNFLSFARKQGCFSTSMVPFTVKYTLCAKECENEQKNQKIRIFFGVFLPENT